MQLSSEKSLQAYIVMESYENFDKLSARRRVTIVSIPISVISREEVIKLIIIRRRNSLGKVFCKTVVT